MTPTRLRVAALLLALGLPSCLPEFPELDFPDNPDTDWDGDGYTEHEGDCDDADPDASPASVWYLDTDLDGYGDDARATTSCTAPGGATSQGGDCDDTSPAVFPGAEERCDLIDDDCDGLVDDDDDGVTGQGTWYADRDGDEWGDAGAPMVACFAPTQSSATPGDCDDTNAYVFPDAPEICNDLDDDCDSLIDDEDDDVERVPVWYVDDDGDGYGDPSDATVTACDGPAGTTDIGGDCDDAAASINPGVDETCNRIDDDCDNLVDGEDPGVVGAATFYRDEDRDGYGVDDTTAPRCEEGDGWAAAGGDCNDADPMVSPGIPEVCNGVDDDCSGVADDGITCAG